MIRRVGVLALPLLVALGTAATPAAADPAAPVLAVTTAKPAYRTGEAPALRFTVTNHGQAPCQLAAASDVVLQVTSLTRDGTPVPPAMAWSTFGEGYLAGVMAQAKTLAPGESGTFPVTLVAGAVPASHPVPGGGAVTSLWPVGGDGRYRLSLVYGAPSLATGGAPLCAGLTEPVTVSFRVGGTDPHRPLWWWLVIAGAVLLLVLVIVVLVWRLRRRRPVPVATAVLFLVVIALVAGTGSRPASASWDDSLGDAAFRKVVDDCVNGFYLPSNDPAGIMPAINDLNGPVVTIRPQLPGQGHRTFDTPLAPGGKGSSTILFNPKSDFVHVDDGDLNTCAELYHELFHAWENIKGTASSEICDSTGIETDEVEASFAENKYRKAKGLKPRTTYGGKKLPQSLDECKKKKLPPTTGPAKKCRGYQSSCGQTNGDPHLVTFDQRYYDFQAVGEFVAVRSATGDLAVQTRQSPVLGSRFVSANSAVAMRSGADRLGFYLSGDAVTVRLNGAVLELADGAKALPGGGTVTRRESAVYLSGSGYDVDWPDGSTAYLDPIGHWGLRLYLSLAPARHGQVTGLLGDFDGDPKNDLVPVGGGKALDSPAFDQLYHAYGDSWRVAADTSLFDYAAGQGTATFTDRTFPDRPMAASDLPAGTRDGAAAVCQWSGVTDPQLLQACILDVAVTGQAAFAVGSADTQETSGAAGGTPPGGTPAGGTDATLAAGQSTAYTFAGTAGQAVFVQVVSSTVDDACSVLTMRGPDGSALSSGCVINHTGYVDRTVLPVTGQYRVQLEAAKGGVQLRLYTDHDESGELAMDGAPVTATIGQPGAIASYSFTARAGQKVFVEATDSDLPDRCSVIVLRAPDGSGMVAGCVIGGKGFVDGTVLPATGRYTVLVDPPALDLGKVRLHLIEDVDQHGDITVNGPEVTVAVRQPGAVAVLDFTGTAGQRITVRASGATLADACGLLALRGPDSSVLVTGCVIGGSGAIDSFTLPASGRYQVVVDPAEERLGQAQIRVTG